ncbi:carboxylate-amine ligase [Lentzea tibetensis]|uniref:carboxylate-amine ligase n=1 Tax=Lentzea tibetensis TaxID=2591470 RepID=UPI001644A571|nr:YbdK family carboxylate-amine ligase [Lentzea tibetensis]
MRPPEPVSVAEEFLLVDPTSGRPSGRAGAVLARLRDTGLTSFRGELATTQVTATTGPCTSLGDLRATMDAARHRVRDAARAVGVGVLSLGVPYWSSEHPLLGRGERFQQLLRTYAGAMADHEACVCQVHVAVPDRETGVAVLNHLRPWLPTLLALSANSPCHEGRDTGYASWRTVQRSRFPGSGVPPWFSSAADYDEHVERMAECGTLVDEAPFWLARLASHGPVVEIHAADAVPAVEDAVVQAALSRALVRTALTDLADGLEAPQVRDDVCAAALWSAARHGLGGAAVHIVREQQVTATKLLRELVEHVTGALEETGDTDVLAWLESCR